MNCEEGETNINGINNDSIVGQSASKIDPTQCAVMSGEKWMPRKFHCKILVGVKANSWRFCLHLPLSLLLLSFSFSLSPQFLSDRTKTILPFPQQDFKPTDRRREGERRHICAYTLICPPFKWYRQKETTGSWFILTIASSYLRACHDWRPRSNSISTVCHS